MKKYQPGEIVMVDLGEVHEVRGHEQAKLRPCVVVNSFPNLELLVVLPVTSSKRLSFNTIVSLTRGCGGLTKDSAVLCHQSRCVSGHRITGSVGMLEKRDFLKVQTVLSDTLGMA